MTDSRLFERDTTVYGTHVVTYQGRKIYESVSSQEAAIILRALKDGLYEKLVQEITIHEITELLNRPNDKGM